MDFEDHLMQKAFDEARKALDIGEVPVGSVFYDYQAKRIVGRGCNSVNATKNATRHAELNCVDEVLKVEVDFKNIVVYVNVEPCIMCASALLDLKVAAIYFGCKNDRFGGCGSVLDVPELYSCHQNSNGSTTRIVGGFREEEAIELLKSFYKGENPNAPEDKRKPARD